MENSIIARLGQEQAFSTYRPHYSRVKPVTSDQPAASKPSGANTTSPGSNQSAATPSRSVSQTESGSASAKPRADSLSPEGDSASRTKGSASRPPQVRDSIGMSRAEMEMIRELQTRENEVQAHEQAHIAAGGRYVQGGASFTYRMGPDGRMYAVGGEVSIDTSPVPGDPQATLEKAQQIRRAALAPGEPSAQDLQAAAKASRMAASARAELRKEEGPDTAPAGETLTEEANGDRPLGPQKAEAPEQKRNEALHTPPQQVVQQAYLRQSGEEALWGSTMGQRVHRRA